MLLCLCIVPFGESSSKEQPIGQTFFPRLADQIIFLVFFFVLTLFSRSVERWVYFL